VDSRCTHGIRLMNFDHARHSSRGGCLEDVATGFQMSLPRGDSTWPRVVQVMVGNIHRRLFDPELTAADVKEQVRARDHNISTLFAAYIGCGIKAYISRRRIEAAKCLLRKCDASVTEVALTVGYASLSTFTRAFHRETGITPSTYRKLQKK